MMRLQDLGDQSTLHSHSTSANMKAIGFFLAIGALILSGILAPPATQDWLLHQVTLYTFEPAAYFIGAVGTMEVLPNKETVTARALLSLFPLSGSIEKVRRKVNRQMSVTGENLDNTDSTYYYIERQTILHKERNRTKDIIKQYLPEGSQFDVDALYEEVPYYGSAFSKGNKTHIEVLEIDPHNRTSNKVMMFSHGGGNTAGSIYSHQGLAAEIAKRAGIRVYIYEYRLAPENKFPTSLEDALDVYKWLLTKHNATDIILGGDSAGGWLTIVTLLHIRDNRIPLPGGAYMISPVTDMTHNSTDAHKTNEDTDILFPNHRGPIPMGIHYLLGEPPVPRKSLTEIARNPMFSPLFTDLAKLPPLYCQVAGSERLRDEGIDFIKKAKKAGVRAEVDLYKYQQHVFQSWFKFIPEADESMDDVALWIKNL